jgi:hypothetical protein
VPIAVAIAVVIAVAIPHRRGIIRVVAAAGGTSTRARPRN